MLVHNLEQKSDEWFKVRKSMPTASNFSKIITPKGSISSQLHEYAKEVAGLTESKTVYTSDMQFGVDYEDNAIFALELEIDKEIRKVGFISNDKRTAGCSPDGVIYDWGGNTIVSGVEVKCPKTETHIEYKSKNVLPSIYYPQVMGSMAVLEVDEWIFASYDVANNDLFYIEVERNEKWIEKFFDLTGAFNQIVLELKEKGAV